VRLNLSVKDPLLAPVRRALVDLSRSRRALEAIAREPAAVSTRTKRRLVARIRRAADVLNPATGNRLGRLVDAAMTCDVAWPWFEKLLTSVAEEGKRSMPSFLPLGLLASGEALRVRVDPLDWETIWRNLFANALAAAEESKMEAPLTLALAAARDRDPVTGSLGARFVLADNVPQTLTAEMIRGRAAERGLGVVADLVRRHEGFVDVGPPPEGAPTLRKGIILEFSALEADA
jgi:hypothetical protein